MADTSNGGWVRRAAVSVASTRPAASASATVSGGISGARPTMRSSASSTEITLFPLESAGLAARLVDQPDVADPHAPVERLAHVVDGERGDGNGCQRFHFHAGPAGHLHRRLD